MTRSYLYQQQFDNFEWRKQKCVLWICRNWVWKKRDITLHRVAFCQFPFRWIYYSHSGKSKNLKRALSSVVGRPRGLTYLGKSIGKETGKMHLCALSSQLFMTGFNQVKPLCSQAEALGAKSNKVYWDRK